MIMATTVAAAYKMKGPAVVSRSRLCTVFMDMEFATHVSFDDHHLRRHLPISPASIILRMLEMNKFRN
jgi:hypothetical protein